MHARRLDQDDEAKKGQDDGEHQRKIAGPHSEGRAEFKTEALIDEEAAEADEDCAAERIGRVER